MKKTDTGLKRRNQIAVVCSTLLTIVIALTVRIETQSNTAEAKPMSAMSIQSTTVNNTEGNRNEELLQSNTSEVFQQITSQVFEGATGATYDQKAATPAAQVSIMENVQVTNVTTPSHTLTEHTQSRKFYFVTSNFLNVRQNPYGESKLIDHIANKSHFEVIGVKGQWIHLKSGGWALGKYTSYRKYLPKVSHVSMKITPKKQVHVRVGNPTSPLQTGIHKPSNLSVDEIYQIIKNTNLGGRSTAQAIYDVERENGVNAFFTIAVAKLESGNGNSRLAKGKNNLFGLNATGDVYANANRYPTKAASVRSFGHIIERNYIDKGLTTVASVNRKYCPPNPGWKTLVASIVKGDIRKI
ncbi:Bifunctional autolysin precursor [compost metagenome]